MADEQTTGAIDLEELANGRCRGRAGIAVLTSPSRLQVGQPLRALFVSDRPLPDPLLVVKDATGTHRLALKPGGGPPYFWLGVVQRPRRGRIRLVLATRDGRVMACARRRVGRPRPPSLGEGDDVWPVRRTWGRATEGFYSAWIEHLFDAPPHERPSWLPLHQVLRDPQRNLLYNHLGLAEDGPNSRKAVVVKPDCADLPYFLRAYFAWKLRLPLGYRHCDRGSSKRPTRCDALRTNSDQVLLGSRETPAKAFSRFLRRRLSYVHSGSGRTAPDDDESDLYPVPLTRKALRPGVVYVDPYGHLLVVAKRVAQTASASGALYAIDGHPDLSVGRKRFWRGAFLFKASTRAGAGGFKAFRPIVKRDGVLTALTNDELRKQRTFPRPSAQQYRHGTNGFYERMDRVINPRPLSPKQAFGERLKAFYELIQERVDSVAAGERHMREVGYALMKMPAGPRIFETRGSWENFSTPARDLRLLIAIEDVVGFPERVVDHPDRFALPKGRTPEKARSALAQLLAQYGSEHTIEYTKSDGTTQRLTINEVIARAKQLEVAYNPNDCVEIRWGATGRELESCTRHAPQEQQQRMRTYRPWFATRNRPPIR